MNAENILGHLTPFVVMIAAKRVEAGEVLTPELMLECAKQAVEEDNARCARLLAPDGYESNQRREEREFIIQSLGEAVYGKIPKSGKPDWNKRWLACAEAKGVSPDDLQTVDYLTWKAA